MQFLKQIIEKKLESYQNYSVKKYTLRSIWQFYQVVNISISFLKINGINTLNKRDMKLRSKLYTKLINKGTINQKELGKINKFMNSDLNIIIQATELIDNLKERDIARSINFEKTDFIAILGSELEGII